MFKLLFRMAMFGLGMALLLDTVLPAIQETLHVDQHTSHSKTERDAMTNRSSKSTSYKLVLVGGQIHSCEVGYMAYTSVSDGEEVIVKASKIFHTCAQITTTDNSQVIYDYNFWRIFKAIVAGFFIACAFGWVRLDALGAFNTR